MTLRVDHGRPTAYGLSGVLFRPPGPVRRGVVLVGGSEGGLHETDARLLAEHGFAVLALAYFGANGVPPVLVDIPLEYFSRAVDLLIDAGVRPGRVGFLGGSRGGEASLLVAAHDDRVGAVVSVVGSGVVTAGIDYRAGRLDRILGTQATSWTLGRQPVSQLPYRIDADLLRQIEAGGIIRLRDAYPRLPLPPDELDRVAIPVERIVGAVLLLSAEDDQMWDSPGLSQVAADRLAAHDHQHADEHVVYPGAGHAIAGPPGAPITSTRTPGPGVTFEMGGSPEATTRARAAAWERSIEFLDEHLATDGG